MGKVWKGGEGPGLGEGWKLGKGLRKRLKRKEGGGEGMEKVRNFRIRRRIEIKDEETKYLTILSV